jgi:hypothetical protein
MAGFVAKEMRKRGRNLLLSAIVMLPMSCGWKRQFDVPAGESADPPARIEEKVTSEPELEVHRGS